MSEQFYQSVDATLREIDEQGLTKPERILVSAQGTEIEVQEGGNRRKVLNFCANNYLGLADNPELQKAAAGVMEGHGFGMASVRFICGTQDLHRKLEQRIAGFFGFDDAVTFAACFDANGAVFEPLCWGPTMRSFRTASIMLRSSMAFGCARRNAIVLPTMTWLICAPSWKQRTG